MEEGTLDHALLLRALSQPFPCKSLLGTRSTPPQWSSTACPSVLLCAVLGSCALGHLGGRKLISPGSITALSGLRDHEAELPPEFVPPPPRPPPRLNISACPWSSWWPHGNSFVECQGIWRGSSGPTKGQGSQSQAKPQLPRKFLSPCPCLWAISEQTAWGLFC